MQKFYEGQAVEMLGEKHGGGFNEQTIGWQKGFIKKLGKTTIILKFDGWQDNRISIDAFKSILEQGTMRIKETTNV